MRHAPWPHTGSLALLTPALNMRAPDESNTTPNALLAVPALASVADIEHVSRLNWYTALFWLLATTTVVMPGSMVIPLGPLNIALAYTVDRPVDGLQKRIAFKVKSAIHRFPAQSGTAPRGAPSPVTTGVVAPVVALRTKTALAPWSLMKTFPYWSERGESCTHHSALTLFSTPYEPSASPDGVASPVVAAIL